MYPIKLTIEGLYSYQKPQTIHFDELTAIGLFGIFGPTGSGKSSILEAISLALYNETERLNNRDNRNYNVMNLKSDRTFIEFDFRDYKNELYRATYELKRSSKRFEDVRSPQRVFYKWENETWRPLEHVNAEEIIELSYNNFKRTIIIPQGKFRDFIELPPASRTSMLMEIFDLNRFDLYDKAARLRNTAELSLSEMAGRLHTYENITEEGLSELTAQLEKITQERTQQEEAFKKKEIEFKELERIKDVSDKLTSKKEELASQLEQKETIEQQEEELQEFERIHRNFFHPVKLLKDVSASLQTKQSDYEQNKAELEKLKSHFEKNQKDLEEILPEFNTLDRKKQTAKDLENILKIKQFSSEAVALQSRIETGKKKTVDQETRLEATKKAIESLETEIEDLKTKQLDPDVLVNVGTWFTQLRNIRKIIEERKEKIDNIQNNIADKTKSIEKGGSDPAAYKQSLSDKILELKTQTAQLRTQQSRLAVHQQLSEYVSELHDGKACPLCGSLEHPDVLKAEDVTSQLQDIQSKINSNEVEKDHIQHQITELEKMVFEREQLEKNYREETTQYDRLKEDLKAHQSRFTWVQFDAENPEHFEEQKRLSHKTSAQIRQSENHLKENRAKLKEEENALKTFADLLQKLEQQKRDKETSAQNFSQMLVHLKLEEYDSATGQNITTQIEQTIQNIQETERKHATLTQKAGELVQSISGKTASLNEKEKIVAEIKNNIQKINEEIARLLISESGKDIGDIQTILSKELSVTKIKNLIDDYKSNLKATQNSITELEAELGTRTFDPVIFEQAADGLLKLKESLEQTNSKKIGLQKDIRNLEEKLKEKKALFSEHSKLEKRFQNLKLLAGLFSGKGFVKFVSTFYLNSLCRNANERFIRMTRNQLELRLSDNDDFEIIDSLNDGRKRSVKTLSGGQSFQVSLSLALALAESVQSHARSENNFFFIDEGFGTQDHESAQIVFDTLLSLNREHKSVGIISHVDELKEMVPASLSISLDVEKGSLIHYG